MSNQPERWNDGDRSRADENLRARKGYIGKLALMAAATAGATCLGILAPTPKGGEGPTIHCASTEQVTVKPGDTLIGRMDPDLDNKAAYLAAAWTSERWQESGSRTNIPERGTFSASDFPAYNSAVGIPMPGLIPNETIVIPYDCEVKS